MLWLCLLENGAVEGLVGGGVGAETQSQGLVFAAARHQASSPAPINGILFT